MKVLFVYDVAHVCEDLSPHLNALGVETEFLKLDSVPKMAWKIEKSHADIIHGNYIRSPAYACFFSFKRPYVLMAHGDDVRHGFNRLQKFAIGSALRIFYTTEELGRFVSGTWIPTPVDCTMFSKREHPGKKALYFEQNTGAPATRGGEPTHIEWIKRYCQNWGLELTYRAERTIPYKDMPEYLSQFSMFFDHVFPYAHSKMALECMALGIPVLPEKGIPMEDQYEAVKTLHDSKVVAEKLKREYEEVLKR